MEPWVSDLARRLGILKWSRKRPAAVTAPSKSESRPSIHCRASSPDRGRYRLFGRHYGRLRRALISAGATTIDAGVTHELLPNVLCRDMIEAGIRSIRSTHTCRMRPTPSYSTICSSTTCRTKWRSQPFRRRPDQRHDRFFGAAQTVTGSCIRSKPAPDASGRLRPVSGAQNPEGAELPTVPFSLRRHRRLLFTHAHIDHSGLLSKLVPTVFPAASLRRAAHHLCSYMLRRRQHPGVRGRYLEPAQRSARAGRSQPDLYAGDPMHRGACV